MKRIQLFIIILLIIVSCSPKITVGVTTNEDPEIEVLKTSNIPIKEHSIQAVLWQQLSAEYKSLCYQSFNLAKIRLDHILLENKSTKPLAIITDIDETVLDNSPYSASLIEEGANYNSESWIAWGKLESAKAVPGAIDFFNYAANKPVEVFYISNRKDIQQKETLANLEKLGLPFCDHNHLLLRTDTSSKKERRNSILKTHDVVLIIGDNLGDFSDIFDHSSTLRRNEMTDSLKTNFGKSFIMLPNPMYGSWEYGLYDENPNDWSEVEKDSIRRVKLKSY